MYIPKDAKEAVCLIKMENSSMIKDIYVHPNPTLGVFFTSQGEDAYYLYQYKDGNLRIILRRSRENAGIIGYITLGMDGSLYYLYRQRSNLQDSIQWSYLEIGMFRVSDLKREKRTHDFIK